MSAVLDLVRLLAAISLIWGAAAVLLAATLSALFRAQDRIEARWRAAERRRAWFEASR